MSQRAAYIACVTYRHSCLLALKWSRLEHRHRLSKKEECLKAIDDLKSVLVKVKPIEVKE
jgi:hypothetical protein